MTKFSAVIAAAGIVIATGLTTGLVVAQANRITQGQVYTAVTADEVAKVLEALGYSATITTGSLGDPQVKFKVGSSMIEVDFYGCGTTACKSTTLYFRLDLARGATFEQVNEWNFDNRFTRAVVNKDDDKDPILESDLDFTGGVTLNAFREWVQVFVKATKDFPVYFE